MDSDLIAYVSCDAHMPIWLLLLSIFQFAKYIWFDSVISEKYILHNIVIS